MAATPNRYEPDYAVPPGHVLKERLDAQGMTPAELARRCGRSAKLISEIVAGKAPIEPRTALQFERVLGVDAGIWLGIETDYRLQQTRAAAAEEAAAAGAWSRSFPLRELVKRGIRPAAGGDMASALLSFFGVASVDAWHAKYGAGKRRLPALAPRSRATGSRWPPGFGSPRSMRPSNRAQSTASRRSGAHSRSCVD